MYCIRKKVPIIFFAMFVVNVVYSASLENVFIGRWCWELNSEVSNFSIIFTKKLDEYIGGYDAVALGGNIIDESEDAFRFKDKYKNSIKTTIKSGITGNIGLVELKFLDYRTIEWIVIHAPKGEFYAPKKAILQKCR